MTYRSPARYLALLALLAAAFAVYLVVQSGSSGESSSSASTTAPATRTTTTTKQHRATKRTYTVRPGDTLSGIAERTGVPLTRLEQLNPDVDVNTLNAGQRLKLRPSS